MASDPITGLIRRRISAYNARAARDIDPAAALAVAAMEGLSGGVGDNGTSFGPWQLHKGGALPSHAPRGQEQGWAMSPAGIDYALSKIGSVAGGLTGRAAVEAIVRQFERPAAPDREVAGAWGKYGTFGGGGEGGVAAAPLSPALSDPAQQGPNRAAFTRALIDQAGKKPDAMGLLQAMQQPTETSSDPFAFAGAMQTPEATVPQQQDPGAAVPGGMQGMLAAIEHAQQMGLRVGENPYVDPVDPVHTEGSYHYRNFGKFNGKPVGRGADISGDPAKMAAFYDWAAKRYPSIAELFYDPRGGIDNGHKIGAIGGHADHVHIAF